MITLAVLKAEHPDDAIRELRAIVDAETEMGEWYVCCSR